MIKGRDAVETARKLIGTPYSTLDCINLVKKVIRTAPGGDPKFTVAHVPALWASGNNNVSSKYRYLTWRQENLSNPKVGLLAFKGKPLGFDHQPSHIGIVAKKDGQWTVIHSSSVYGQVVETPLTAKENWSLLAEIKYIAPEKEESKGVIPMQEFMYNAVVHVDEGSTLNLRAKPATGGTKILAKIPQGSTVHVLEETNDKWVKVAYEGETGYCYSKYLEKVETPEPVALRMIITDSEGNRFHPVGDFIVSFGEAVD